MMNERIVRVPLPANLVKKLDQLLLKQLGGYETRAEFIKDAIDAMIVELTYPEAPKEPNFIKTKKKAPWKKENQLGFFEPAHLALSEVADSSGEEYEDDIHVENYLNVGLEDTALFIKKNCFKYKKQTIKVTDEPIFGMHTRDYPTFWAATILADMSEDKPVIFTDFIKYAIELSWEFGKRLTILEGSDKIKLSNLFPKNLKKKQAAEGAFRNFGIGNYKIVDEGILATGPIFQWGLCQLENKDGAVYGALTETGVELLGKLKGITAEIPHGKEAADIFLKHIKKHSPLDWHCFFIILQALEGSPTRDELLKRFQIEWPQWTPAQLSTNLSGYISRAREWGLVSPTITGRRYSLTDYGLEIMSSHRGG